MIFWFYEYLLSLIKSINQMQNQLKITRFMISEIICTISCCISLLYLKHAYVI